VPEQTRRKPRTRVLTRYAGAPMRCSRRPERTGGSCDDAIAGCPGRQQQLPRNESPRQQRPLAVIPCLPVVCPRGSKADARTLMFLGPIGRILLEEWTSERPGHRAAARPHTSKRRWQFCQLPTVKLAHTRRLPHVPFNWSRVVHRELNVRHRCPESAWRTVPSGDGG